MSQFFPHTAYAEDQPLSHTILYVHVLTRAIQAGTVVGTGIGSSIYALRYFNILKSRIPPATFTSTLLRSTGTGTLVATGLLAISLPVRMWGREEIEWKDRSWRLLENKGQVECDDWTYGAMVLGGASAIPGYRILGWRGAVGSVGLSSVVGMMGYMGWRYGVNGGQFEEERNI
jgi:hypothetical protein